MAASISPLVAASLHSAAGETARALPDDTSSVIGPAGIAWLSKYHVPLQVLLQQGVRWSEKYQQLLFTYPDESFYQARNFREGKSKYFTSGSHEDFLPIYPLRRTHRHHGSNEVVAQGLVLVEDCVSAISVARALEGSQTHAMPLLGSHLAAAKLVRLTRLYDSLVVWLDHDKGKEAMNIARRAGLLGMTTKVVQTTEDPKCLTPEELCQVLS